MVMVRCEVVPTVRRGVNRYMQEMSSQPRRTLAPPVADPELQSLGIGDRHHGKIVAHRL